MATTTESSAEVTQTVSDAADSQSVAKATEVQETHYGMANVHEVGGIEISIFGMTIVFLGLLMTFCWISLLPMLVGERKPKVKKAKPELEPKPAGGATTPIDGLSPELQAAIAYVIAAEQEYEQLTDYTKITIRRDENQQAWGVAGKMRTLATRKLNYINENRRTFDQRQRIQNQSEVLFSGRCRTGN